MLRQKLKSGGNARVLEFKFCFLTHTARERGVRVAGVLYYATRVMILVVQSGSPCSSTVLVAFIASKCTNGQ